MKKIVIISLALILALGGLGAAYAAWTDEVVITETVYTGDLCVGVTSITLKDGGLTPAQTGYVVGTGGPGHDWTVLQTGPLFYVNPPPLDKNVGWATSALAGPEDFPSPLVGTLYHSLTVTSHNVYPCYYNHVDFWLGNCGTVPFKVNRLILSYTDAAGNPQEEIYTPLTQLGYKVLDLGGEVGTPDLEFHWGNNWLEQWEPGEGFDMSMAWHVLQDHFAENESWDFTITFEVIQWNEWPY